jgi:hypothetical protein
MILRCEFTDHDFCNNFHESLMNLKLKYLLEKIVENRDNFSEHGRDRQEKYIIKIPSKYFDFRFMIREY